MATFSLVHGAWGGGWLWDQLRAELESRGHVVHAPDLPCEDVAAGVAEYVAVVPAEDVVVGYLLGGLTIPFVEAETHVSSRPSSPVRAWRASSSAGSATRASATSSGARLALLLDALV